MATWEDGPEYAPLERPELFEEPDVAPLPVAVATVSPAAGAPTQPPAGYQQPDQPTIPLEALVPAGKPTRDPQEAFDVAAAAITSQGTGGGLTPLGSDSLSDPTAPLATSSSNSAWGATHSSGIWAPPAGAPAGQPFDPNAPIALADRTQLWETSSTGRPGGSILQPAPRVQMSPWGPPPATQPPGVGLPAGYGVPGTPSWFGPGAQPEPAQPKPVTFRSIVDALTPGVAIALAVGTVVFPLSPIVYLVAAILGRYTRYRRSFAKTLFGLGLLVIVFFAFIGITLDSGNNGWWTTVSITGSVCSLLTLLVLAVTMGVALRSGERPERA